MEDLKTEESVAVVGTKCKKCGFKVRGENHNEGTHHKNGKKGKKGS